MVRGRDVVLRVASRRSLDDLADTSIYSDFKDVDGLVYPMSTMGTFEGKPSMSVTITSMSVDGPLDETAFVMPEGAATSGGR